MAFFRNDAVNRVNVHSGVQALATSGGGVFFVVFLVEVGLPVPAALSAMAAIMAVRFLLRPAILPLARRWGLKPLLILGTVGLAFQYPLLAEVHGVGGALVVLCLVAALGDIFYWPAYNAYFAAIGDAEHRGQQVGAREALTSVAGVLAPLLGAWALVTFGPRPMFAAIGLIQALAAIPLIGAPNVAVKPTAPGAFRAARLGAMLYATDGWFDACFFFVWQIALFVSLGESFGAYGGAMALAGLVGAVCGLWLGRHIDRGHGRRAVALAYGVATAVVLLRAASFGSPWLAVGANALGPLLMSLMLPTLGRRPTTSPKPRPVRSASRWRPKAAGTRDAPEPASPLPRSLRAASRLPSPCCWRFLRSPSQRHCSAATMRAARPPRSRRPAKPRKSGHETAAPSDHVLLAERPSRRDPVVAERRQVEARIAAVDDQLGEAAADRRGLLQAVAGEADGKEQIADARQRADDGVVVEEVHVVVAGPCAAGLYRLEGGDAGGEHRPDRLLEEGVVHLEIGRRRIVLRRRRGAAMKTSPSGRT